MLVVYLLIAIVFIVVSTTKFKLHPFLALIFAALGYGLLSGMEFSDIVASVNNGFGNIVGYIGIVIIIGCIIGTFLEESGGAYIMARSVIRFSGEKRVTLAMLILGYIISIPVYADSGFVILSPLNKALTKRAGLSLACTVIALSLGLTITHCLVPPTPGPISAAAILGADLGLVILTGLAASIVVAVVAYFFVTGYVARTYIAPTTDASDEDAVERVKNAPSATKSFIPIIVPLLLIVLKSISDFPTAPFGDGVFFKIISFIGEPIIALLIGMLFAFLLPKKLEREMLSTTGWVGKSLNSAAVIIMITAAGGSFGMVLQDSGIADVLAGNMAAVHNRGGAEDLAGFIDRRNRDNGVADSPAHGSPRLRGAVREGTRGNGRMLRRHGRVACQRQLLLGGDTDVRPRHKVRLQVPHARNAGVRSHFDARCMGNVPAVLLGCR